MVRVRVAVSQLAIDLDKQEKRFRRGEEFECPAERALRLGNSVEILEEASPEPLPETPAKKRK